MLKETYHKPCDQFFGEDPTTEFPHGPENLKVVLRSHGLNEGSFFATLFCELQSNWGGVLDIRKDEDLTPDQWKVIRESFAGWSLQQALENLTFAFCIEGLTRAATHQIVRSRIGVSAMQQGGRDNDWRHHKFVIPETIRRMSIDLENFEEDPEEKHGIQYENFYNLHSCLERSLKFHFLSKYSFPMMNNQAPSLEDLITFVIGMNKDLYAILVDMGIPYQDARRVLPIGLDTHIYMNYNYLSLQNMLGKRLEYVMDWEINCIAQLMVREVFIACELYKSERGIDISFVADNLRSISDKCQQSKFNNLSSWPPDQKYPEKYDLSSKYNNPRQMPFWILSGQSLIGGDVKWIPTNGEYWNPAHEEDSDRVPDNRSENNYAEGEMSRRITFRKLFRSRDRKEGD